jgi:hypothetical protein
MNEPLFVVKPPHDKMLRDAVLSDCGTYRYELSRRWDVTRGRVGFIMLNPSTADGQQDDPTIRRCIGFAKAWGYGWLVVRNLYALRATDPKELWKHPAPVGPDNDGYLLDSVNDPVTVCAWGANGRRGDAVINALSDAGVALHYLELTRAGKPKHPLYLRADLTPAPFSGGENQA